MKISWVEWFALSLMFINVFFFFFFVTSHSKSTSVLPESSDKVVVCKSALRCAIDLNCLCLRLKSVCCEWKCKWLRCECIIVYDCCCFCIEIKCNSDPKKYNMAGLKCKQNDNALRSLNISPVLFAGLSVIYVLIVISPFGYVRAEHHCNHQHPRADEVSARFIFRVINLFNYLQFKLD